MKELPSGFGWVDTTGDDIDVRLSRAIRHYFKKFGAFPSVVYTNKAAIGDYKLPDAKAVGLDGVLRSAIAAGLKLVGHEQIWWTTFILHPDPRKET